MSGKEQNTNKDVLFSRRREINSHAGMAFIRTQAWLHIACKHAIDSHTCMRTLHPFAVGLYNLPGLFTLNDYDLLQRKTYDDQTYTTIKQNNSFSSHLLFSSHPWNLGSIFNK